MKLKLIISTLFLVGTLSSEYIVTLDKKHYQNNVSIGTYGEESNNTPSFESPDDSGTLTLREITNSNHGLGEGWFSFDESTVSNFSSFSSNINTVIDSNHSKFAIYHSDDLYFIFERPLTSSDGSNIHGRPYWSIHNSNVTVNVNNVSFPSFIHIVTHGAVSGLVFSGVAGHPWCSPVHGRYNGSCYSGQTGIGDWTIFLKQ